MGDAGVLLPLGNSIKGSHMGEATSTGLLVTIAVFVLAVIFGLILRADARKAPKTKKAAAATSTPTTESSEVQVRSQPDSWKKSAERFKKFASRSDS
jgi:hypothetical protein